MQEIHGHVSSAPVREILGDITASAHVTTDTVILLADSVDFSEQGGSVRILGEVYQYESVTTWDEDDDTAVPSITLAAPGLIEDVPEGTPVERWNPNALNGAGDVVANWTCEVADDVDGSSAPAVLYHSLIPMLGGGEIPLAVGDSVTVHVSDSGRREIVQVHGGTPSVYPEYFRSGVIDVDTVLTVGTPGGKRVVIDGGIPAIQAFDSSNSQTVNIDGEDNFMQGSIATAADGARVEIGSGELGALPTEEARFYTGSADETGPAKIRAIERTPLPGTTHGMLEIVGQEWDDGGTPLTPAVRLSSGTNLGGASSIELTADDVLIDAANPVSIPAGLSTDLVDGSVGTGTFRDSVDARVTAVAPGAVPAASTTAAGKVELATDAETITGTDTARAITPANLAASRADMGHIERSADGTQNIATGGSGTVILWQDSVVAGRGGVTYSSGVFDVSLAGTYIISANVYFPANATGLRIAVLRKNGSAIARFDDTANAAGAWSVTLTQVVDCAAGDDLDVLAFQSSGGNLAIDTVSYVSIHRLA